MTTVIETGLSDFHKLTVTTLKSRLKQDKNRKYIITVIINISIMNISETTYFMRLVRKVFMA